MKSPEIVFAFDKRRFQGFGKRNELVVVKVEGQRSVLNDHDFFVVLPIEGSRQDLELKDGCFRFPRSASAVHEHQADDFVTVESVPAAPKRDIARVGINNNKRVVELDRAVRKPLGSVAERGTSDDGKNSECTGFWIHKVGTDNCPYDESERDCDRPQSDDPMRDSIRKLFALKSKLRVRSF